MSDRMCLYCLVWCADSGALISAENLSRKSQQKISAENPSRLRVQILNWNWFGAHSDKDYGWSFLSLNVQAWCGWLTNVCWVHTAHSRAWQCPQPNMSFVPEIPDSTILQSTYFSTSTEQLSFEHYLDVILWTNKIHVYTWTNPGNN